VCDPKIAQLDKEHNTILSRDNFPQINGEQKLRQMINEASQIKAHHAGGARAYDSCPAYTGEPHDPHTRVSPSLLAGVAGAPLDLPDVAEVPGDSGSVSEVPRDSGGVTKTSGFISPEQLAQQSEQQAQYGRHLGEFLQGRQVHPPSIPTTGPQPPTSYPSMFASFSGGSDDLWSNPMFEDAKPPPGAPPFDISMFAGSIRAPTNLNPI
jgi:hypothetical protein